MVIHNATEQGKALQNLWEAIEPLVIKMGALFPNLCSISVRGHNPESLNDPGEGKFDVWPVFYQSPKYVPQHTWNKAKAYLEANGMSLHEVWHQAIKLFPENIIERISIDLGRIGGFGFDFAKVFVLHEVDTNYYFSPYKKSQPIVPVHWAIAAALMKNLDDFTPYHFVYAVHPLTREMVPAVQFLAGRFPSYKLAFAHQYGEELVLAMSFDANQPIVQQMHRQIVGQPDENVAFYYLPMIVLNTQKYQG